MYMWGIKSKIYDMEGSKMIIVWNSFFLGVVSAFACSSLVLWLMVTLSFSKSTL